VNAQAEKNWDQAGILQRVQWRLSYDVFICCGRLPGQTQKSGAMNFIKDTD